MNTNRIPMKINVTRTISYDVADILENMSEFTTVKRELTAKHLVEWIMDWIFDDMSRIVRTLDELTFTDENGEEITITN